ncbi:MAG: hypothetical protein U0M42_09455 [Acutalibacteraceae bacterium]|nr:hypothetical protein [Acutalibacteraceae bacterium]
MWIIRLTGCALLIGVGTVLGIKAAQKLKKRVKKLGEIIVCTDRIAQYIRLESGEIGYILDNTLPEGISFDGTGVIVKNGIALSIADTELLNEFLTGLGMGDKFSEQVKCNAYKHFFIKQMEEAQRDVDEKYKLYSTGGFILSAVLSFLWW